MQPNSFVMPDTMYTTTGVLLGKHYWRIQVYENERYGPCTRMEWWDEDRWRPEKEWPTYDSHADDSGLPVSLGRIFAAHRQAIERALQGNPIPRDPVSQPSLF
jgi:hypothetical protein